MSSRNQWVAKTLLCVAVVVGLLSFAPSSSAGSSGLMYIYYETSAMLVETGGKVVCPGYVVFDEGPDGTFQQTPFFVVETVACFGGGGGAGGGGGFSEEDDGPE